MSFILAALEKNKQAQQTENKTTARFSRQLFFKWGVGLILGMDVLFLLAWLMPPGAPVSPTIEFIPANAQIAGDVYTVQSIPALTSTLLNTSVPDLADLPLAIQQQIPPLKINALKYVDNPQQRVVMINTYRYSEAMEIRPGMKLERIESKGVIINYHQHRFRLPYP